MNPAFCHFCGAIDTKWERGPVWRHIWCGFRVPAAHVWFPGEPDTIKGQLLDSEPIETLKQLTLWEEK